jgi:hypothetical protein
LRRQDLLEVANEYEQLAESAEGSRGYSCGPDSTLARQIAILFGLKMESQRQRADRYRREAARIRVEPRPHCTLSYASSFYR